MVGDLRQRGVKSAKLERSYFALLDGSWRRHSVKEHEIDGMFAQPLLDTHGIRSLV